ncbi:uncharacterized protein LOC112686776 isoform X2 [Sipha flava]|uniref:Uncharacterized protein LOC112686776 isoform X2 n=1 Tax=Sipha flava TaxID=143950 RepID=A0A8B8FXA9_9HEMI|nr:uncharacterized protein LOC112686776 isoform X2 [Sipha flava]
MDIFAEGHGTTNDGNTARTFFRNAEKSAEITGVNLNLIERFKNILMVMASGQDIDTNSFDEYGIQTAKLFVSLHPWFYMPSSLHKILIHGADVIRYAVLPIGYLSEEAQESRNKDFKMYRRHHTRKNSRINTNKDLLHVLLISSDPLISTIRLLPKKKITRLIKLS